jgi:hypothetical protein
MANMKKLLALLTVAVLLSLGTVAYAANGRENQEKILEVKNWKGKHIGIVKYVVQDPSTGNVTFLILHLDKEAKKEIAVPLAAFSSFDQYNGILVLNVSEQELASAPEFHDLDLNNPDFAEGIYRFFGLVPCCTEERKEEGEKEYESKGFVRRGV